MISTVIYNIILANFIFLVHLSYSTTGLVFALPFFMRYWLVIVFAILISSSARSQGLILQTEPVKSKLIDCFYHTYNSDTVKFPEAAALLKEFIPDHPANDLLTALSIYWSKYPLNLNGSELGRMTQLLKVTMDQCHERLDENEDDFEIKYLDMVAHAMQAMTYSINRQFFRAASESKKAYNYFREGFELMNDYKEFYFSSGLYSYYREKYPEKYPVYKSIIWVFKSGDKEEGLKLMKKAVEEATFAKAEASHYTAHILFRYEMKAEESLPYARLLAEEYPKNLFFKSNYIENLLFLKQFEEAETVLDSFPETNHAYYRMAKSVFKAIIGESKFEYELAETLFNQSLEFSKLGVNEEIDNLKNLAYCGLARLSLQVNDQENAERYYKLALEEVKYEIYQQEPEEYLELHK